MKYFELIVIYSVIMGSLVLGAILVKDNTNMVKGLTQHLQSRGLK